MLLLPNAYAVGNKSSSIPCSITSPKAKFIAANYYWASYPVPWSKHGYAIKMASESGMKKHILK